ncbi:ABC transporter ATP-binding protein [Falsochrobactrum sp. TDYN1]|uniref:ABC transporter ATP-binding protein n=1 Tax=Falsochrobactrum tianjinense TaxID=2706015 RepID=A0A949PPA9_9HYPH|nr:ABC transporter ATP-binding protein [Falsochrobactrum sp. TDYN1]MBV2143561.1 ABC transporter ATP-binding protein [Falsochrobactrum sp. TDYN1]
MQTALTLEGIGKRYGEFTALYPTDLTIKAGEFLTLLGPSGSGKTTLLMTIAGFVEPGTGQMLLDGTDITRIPPEARNFGVVFQGYALFPHLSVWDNVFFPLRARNISRNNARQPVEEALELMELTQYSHRLPKELSGGQQQRVALARALVFKPELLLLDEPLSALDKTLRRSLQTELKSLHKKVGTTFVYVTHDQEEALSMSDRIAVLNGGRIQQLDTPDRMYHKPDSAFVADFLGRSNFIRGEIASISGESVVLQSGIGSLPAQRGAPLRTGEKAAIAIRPERIQISTEEPLLPNRFMGEITDTTFLGGQLDLEVNVAGERLSASVPAVQAAQLSSVATGSKVWLGWDTSAARALPIDGAAIKDIGTAA